MNDLLLRSGRAEDAAACGRIGYAAFKAIAEKHGFLPDFPSPEAAQDFFAFLFTNPQVDSVVAERAGRVLGSNALWPVGPVGGVGPITIDPESQDAGLGRRLMEAVLERARARNLASVRLVQAAYHNRSLSLYAKLGFAAREPLSTIQGRPLGLSLPGYAVGKATRADLPACECLHLGLQGYARTPELAQAVEQGSATLVRRDGRITGYATLIGYFGHAVGETRDDLQALIGAAESFPGPGFLLPTRDAPLLRWCLERGLRVVQPMTLMSLGLYNKPDGAFLPSILF